MAQNPRLDGGNLEIHGLLFGMGQTERRTGSRELLEYVDMDGRTDSLVKPLSGGLKRHRMVACAFCSWTSQPSASPRRSTAASGG